MVLLHYCFQRSLDFIGFDLILSMEESRKRRAMLSHFNDTNIFLIPKVQNPKSFVEFHPISLCNLIYKIFCKALYLRVQGLIPCVISPQQRGFLPRRETTDGAIIAQEVLHFIKKNYFPPCVIKLDMVKAYDKVNWSFLTRLCLNLIFQGNGANGFQLF